MQVTMLDTELDLEGGYVCRITRSHAGDAGWDLRARIEVELMPGQRMVVPTGIAVAVPDGHVGLVCPRSGLAAHDGVTVLNAPGVVDAGYRGEVQVVLLNTGPDPVWLCRGDRIAQLVVTPCSTDEVELVDSLDQTGRGQDGIGSTGR